MEYMISVLRSLINFLFLGKKKMSASSYNIDQYLDLIEEVLTKFKGVVKSNELKKDKFYSILFLCKFYELICDINVLMHSDRYNSIPILFRAALEVSFDIKNIQNSESYLEKLGYTAAKKELTRLNCLSKIEEYCPDDDIQNQIEVYEKIISDIPEDNQKTVQIINKFNNIDSSDILYRVVYSKLCKETHSDMIELQKHFFKLEGNKWTFIYDVAKTDLDKEKFVDVIILTILETIIVTGQINKIDTSKYKNLLSKLGYT